MRLFAACLTVTLTLFSPWALPRAPAAVPHSLESAKEFFLEGKYRQAADELEEFLKSSPEDPRALQLLSATREKISVSEEFLNGAEDDYNAGNLDSALEKLETALALDEYNYRARSMASEILAELAMEYGVDGDFLGALENLYRARSLTPGDDYIEEMIRINEDLVPESLRPPEPDREFEKRVSLPAGIDWDAEYTPEERAGPGPLHAAAAVLLTAGVSGVILIRRKRRPVKAPQEQEPPESAEKEKDTGAAAETGSYEKKIRKIEIIESELAGKDPYENRVAINMLKQFLNDSDHRVKLRIVESIHRIDPSTAAGTLKKIILNEKGEYRAGACRLAGRLGSPEAAELLIELAAIPGLDEKTPLLEALKTAYTRPGLEPEKQRDIKKVIVRLSGGKWVG